MYITIYLIIINIISFLFLSWELRHHHQENKGLDVFVSLIALLGGSVGALVSLAINWKKIKKPTMMQSVAVIVIFILQVIALYVYTHHKQITFNRGLIYLFRNQPYLLVYLLIMNLITFVVFGIDKYKAIKKKRRIPIIRLLALSFMGGVIGGLMAMILFHHKTSRYYFKIGMPLILVGHLFLLFLLANLI